MQENPVHIVGVRSGRCVLWAKKSCGQFVVLIQYGGLCALVPFPFAPQGHAGVTHLSPMEAREVNDPRKVVCVFGRSPNGLPHKVRYLSNTL